MTDIELLAPAGCFETALTAFKAGADAVYLGLNAFSARAEAVNFSSDQLRDLLAYAHPGRRVYVTFNTLLDQSQLSSALDTLSLLDELRPDGLIVQDLGVARLVRRNFPHLSLHASTQLVAHNLEGVLALKELGFSRVVLARELSLEDIRSITRRSGLEIEVFVHGALCYSLSGLCLFSALERQRSGNRGRCAYCCRLPYTDTTGAKSLPFSMRDLRLDDHLEALRDAGVASLKIEGRMKSSLYVGSVTRHYREILDGLPQTTSRADLETVFSRRTTSLYLDGYKAPVNTVIDPTSLGHLGTPIGTVKRLTKDREGRTWLRFHTNRALEKHDGLQFAAPEGGKPYGFGIVEMRLAISRKPVFEVRAGSDVEILVTQEGMPVRSGDTIYCAASNEMRRRFPVPSFRPSDHPSGTPIDLVVTLTPTGPVCTAPAAESTVRVDLPLVPSRHPERTSEAVRKAFLRLGGTGWTLGNLSVEDPDHLFAPASVLNDLRRALVTQLNIVRTQRRTSVRAEADAQLTETRSPEADFPIPENVLKIRLDQDPPDGVCEYDELVVALGHRAGKDAREALTDLLARLQRLAAEAGGDPVPAIRLALPVFTRDRDFNALRALVKNLLSAGYARWEAADLATLRLLTQSGVKDITADWTLYGFNAPALATLAELGVTRCVASPENDAENRAFLARHIGAPHIEFLTTQSTPLFISLTRPAIDDPETLTGVKGDVFTSFATDGLWVTTRPEPRRFDEPDTAHTRRLDLSWDAPLP